MVPAQKTVTTYFWSDKITMHFFTHRKHYHATHFYLQTPPKKSKLYEKDCHLALEKICFWELNII